MISLPVLCAPLANRRSASTTTWARDTTPTCNHKLGWRSVTAGNPGGAVCARLPVAFCVLRPGERPCLPRSGLVGQQRNQTSFVFDVEQECCVHSAHAGKDKGAFRLMSAVAFLALSDAQGAAAYGIGVPTAEATPLQNAFGAAFTIFCGWYFVRVVRKRGKRAKEFRVANKISKEEQERNDAEAKERSKKLSASQAFLGGITGLSISLVLYQLASSIQTSFDGRSVPESYTVRQISMTVRTIVEGLAYLATFVYAANGAGLLALSVKKLVEEVTGQDIIDEYTEKLSNSVSTSSQPVSPVPSANGTQGKQETDDRAVMEDAAS